MTGSYEKLQHNNLIAKTDKKNGEMKTTILKSSIRTVPNYDKTSYIAKALL